MVNRNVKCVALFLNSEGSKQRNGEIPGFNALLKRRGPGTLTCPFKVGGEEEEEEKEEEDEEEEEL